MSCRVVRIAVGAVFIATCILLLASWLGLPRVDLSPFQRRFQEAAEIVRVQASPPVDYRCRVTRGDSSDPYYTSSKVNLQHVFNDTREPPIIDSRKMTLYRCLPNVMFIGASKCGTTSLTDYLDSHEEVYFVNRHVVRRDRHREVHRFDRGSFAWLRLGSLELAGEWASSPALRSSQHPLIHYTPHYLYAPTVAFDVARFYDKSDQMKFIVMLRNPVERAISAYWFQHSHLFTKSGEDEGSPDDLEAAIDRDIQWRHDLEKCLDRFNISLQDPSAEQQALRQCFGASLRSPSLGQHHVDKGVYVDQLARWLHLFPPQNFFVLSLEQWRADPGRLFRNLLLFLGVSPSGSGMHWADTSLESVPSQAQLAAQSFRDTAHYIESQWGLKSPRSTNSSGSVGPTMRPHAQSFEYRDHRNRSRAIDFSHQRLVRPNSRSGAPMADGMRRKLTQFFVPHNRRLVTLLLDAHQLVSGTT